MTSAKHTILLVDDETELREGIHDALELNGYDVVSARDGQAALELLESQGALCVVLLDLVMPRMDGWEFCTRLRALPAYAKVPVIVHSSSSLAPPEGVDWVIRKPLTFVGLLKVVGEFCPKRREGQAV
jgi:CheY-like chemotaxis protein